MTSLRKTHGDSLRPLDLMHGWCSCRAALGTAGLLALLLASGCDVTNPGPIQAEFLTLKDSHDALVNGAARQMVLAESNIVHTVAYLGREVLPGGTIGPGSPGGQDLQAGLIDDEESDGEWSSIQQVRYIGEFAIEALISSGEAEPGNLAEAYIWAGYANRILGENFCEVSFDSGPAQPPEAAFERAEEQLTSAMGVGSGDQALWAQAGRAQVRALAGDWAGASADASAIPIGWEGLLSSDREEVQNDIYDSMDGNYRGHSMRFTFFDQYYMDTGDPRAAWVTDPTFEFANSSLQGYGPVPWTRHTYKHYDYDAPFRLASGTEMKLLQAEAILRGAGGGGWQDALSLINEVRTYYVSETTGLPLDPWDADSEAETWEALMTERGYDTFLEGRRMADLRRWEEEGRPGVENQMPDFRALTDFFVVQPDRCFPIPEVEQERNPNIPEGSCIGCG